MRPQLMSVIILLILLLCLLLRKGEFYICRTYRELVVRFVVYIIRYLLESRHSFGSMRDLFVPGIKNTMRYKKK